MFERSLFLFKIIFVIRMSSTHLQEQRQQIVAQFIQLKLEIHYLLLLQNTVQLIKNHAT